MILNLNEFNQFQKFLKGFKKYKKITYKEYVENFEKIHEVLKNNFNMIHVKKNIYSYIDDSLYDLLLVDNDYSLEYLLNNINERHEEFIKKYSICPKLLLTLL